METKKCTKCSEVKPRTNEFFNKHSTNGDGLNCWCKICISNYTKRWAKTDTGRKIINEGTKKYHQSVKGKKQYQDNLNKLGAGIYEITNLITAYNYVGYSSKLQKRKYDHFSIVNNTSGTCSTLQEDMKKYSPDAFSFAIIESLPNNKKLLEQREDYWIKKLNPKYNTYKK